ncbi:hypothetical protein ACNFBT_23605 [Pseudomonas sp. NY15181]|uniref:hypothetical protein n=1 Tax=Pseudomonas sp. NY15181 TaxID=3400349 RepID=UPI003A889F37
MQILGQEECNRVVKSVQLRIHRDKPKNAKKNASGAGKVIDESLVAERFRLAGKCAK